MGVLKPTFKAVLVSVVVVATGPPPPPPPLLPPQLNTRLDTHNPNPAMQAKLRVLCVSLIPQNAKLNRNTPPAKPTAHQCGASSILAATFTALAAVAFGVKFNGVVAAPPLNVTLEANPQVYPAGTNVPPLPHVRFTVPANPFTGVIVTIELPAEPAMNANGFGSNPTVKSAPVTDAVTVTLGESAACQLLSPR